MERIRPALVRLAYRMVWHRDDAEEIAQDALTLACRKGPTTGDAATLNAWLYRTTVHLSMNRRRRRRKVEPLDRADAVPSTEEVNAEGAESSELTERIRLAMRELPEKQYAALVLRELEGLAYEQIAAILRTRVAAARLLVHRAREGVRRILLERWPETFDGM